MVWAFSNSRKKMNHGFSRMDTEFSVEDGKDVKKGGFTDEEPEPVVHVRETIEEEEYSAKA